MHPHIREMWFILSQTSLERGDGKFHQQRTASKWDGASQKQPGLASCPSNGLSYSPLLAEDTSVSISREIKFGTFPQWWPLRHDTQWCWELDTGCGLSCLKRRVRIHLQQRRLQGTGDTTHWLTQCFILLIFINVHMHCFAGHLCRHWSCQPRFCVLCWRQNKLSRWIQLFW